MTIDQAPSSIRLTVIGAAAAYTRRPNASSSCYLLEAGDEAMLLDLGHGSFAALGGRRAPETIGTIVISHEHADHHIDLIPLRHYLMYAANALGAVRLHPPVSLRARYDALTGEDDFLSTLPGEDVTGQPIAAGPFRIQPFRVRHTAHSHGFRVSLDGRPGPGIVYSGDCGDPQQLVAALQPGDTLLTEASFGTGPGVPGVEHLTATQAAEAARDGSASRLILTHILDEYDPAGSLERARSIFSGPSELARTGLSISLDESPPGWGTAPHGA